MLIRNTEEHSIPYRSMWLFSKPSKKIKKKRVKTSKIFGMASFEKTNTKTTFHTIKDSHGKDLLIAVETPNPLRAPETPKSEPTLYLHQDGKLVKLQPSPETNIRILSPEHPTGTQSPPEPPHFPASVAIPAFIIQQAPASPAIQPVLQATLPAVPAMPVYMSVTKTGEDENYVYYSKDGKRYAASKGSHKTYYEWDSSSLCWKSFRLFQQGTVTAIHPV